MGFRFRRRVAFAWQLRPIRPLSRCWWRRQAAHQGRRDGKLLHRQVRMGLSALIAVETVEQIEARLAQLVLRRQRLRELGADDGTLERNRQTIVAAQWELSRALIA